MVKMELTTRNSPMDFPRCSSPSRSIITTVERLGQTPAKSPNTTANKAKVANVV